MNNNVKKWLLDFPGYSGYIWQVRWTNLQGIHAKFSQDLMHQKLLKSVNFRQSCSKNKRWTFLGHSVGLLIIIVLCACDVSGVWLQKQTQEGHQYTAAGGHLKITQASPLYMLQGVKYLHTEDNSDILTISRHFILFIFTVFATL